MSWLLVSKKCGNCRNSCGAWHSWANRRQHFCEQNQDVPDTSAAHSSGIGGYHPVGLLFVLPWISEILFHILQRWHVPWIWIQTCVCVCVCVLCHAKLLQLRRTLCDPMDCSLPGSSVHGILQTRILEWVTTPSSRGSFHPRYWILSPASSAL